MSLQAPVSAPRADLLLDQQLWFLGQDIRHADGNALTRFGFQRLRAPGATASAYVLLLEPALGLVCMGFGVYLGPVSFLDETAAPPAGHGVVWRRHTRSPRLTRRGLLLPLRGPNELPETCEGTAGESRAALAISVRRLARVFAAYEAWAITTLGPAHRGRALAALPRHKRLRLPALLPALTGAWMALST